jgi:ABC-type phosphate/phosphonate transport system substrate-binding protein
VYFSDIITRSGQEADWDNQGGSTWAYNERGSFSGWVAVVDDLRRRGLDLARVVWVETGSHLRSMAMVGDKHADLCGIDSMVWEIETYARPQLAQQLTVVASLGPWPMPPLMASRQLDARLLSDLSEAIASAQVENGLISRWDVVDDRHLDPIIRVVQSLTERSLLP